jgi:hypothetical protein
MKQRLLTALLLAGSLAQPAAAHMVWLEREGSTVQLFFGEYAEGLRERAGGHLDAIKNPRLIGATAPLSRQPDHLAFSPLPTGDARAVEELAPWQDRQRGGRTRTVFLAREGRAEPRPGLDLELVPAWAGSEDFILLFREAPLPRTKVTLIGPHGWTKELNTNAEGRVTLPTPWAGRYVAEIQHLDATAASVNAPAYDRTSYVATLSFTSEAGIPWAVQR